METLSFVDWLVEWGGAEGDIQSICNRINPIFSKAFGVESDWIRNIREQVQKCGIRGVDILQTTISIASDLYHKLSDPAFIQQGKENPIGWIKKSAYLEARKHAEDLGVYKRTPKSRTQSFSSFERPDEEKSRFDEPDRLEPQSS